mgnify:CR=1 FL=1
MKINYINPENLFKPKGYSHAIAVSGNRKTLYIGGQNAIDEKGNIVGKGDIKEQTRQILENIEKILGEAGAKLENIIKLNIYILQGQNPQEGFGVFQQKWGSKPNLPIVTVLFVAGLGNPDWLLEIDAVAEVPE